MANPTRDATPSDSRAPCLGLALVAALVMWGTLGSAVAALLRV